MRSQRTATWSFVPGMAPSGDNSRQPTSSLNIYGFCAPNLKFHHLKPLPLTRGYSCQFCITGILPSLITLIHNVTSLRSDLPEYPSPHVIEPVQRKGSLPNGYLTCRRHTAPQGPRCLTLVFQPPLGLIREQGN